MNKLDSILRTIDYDENNLMNNFVTDVLVNDEDDLLFVINSDRDGVIAVNAVNGHDYDFFTKDSFLDTEFLEDEGYKSIFNGNSYTPFKLYNVLKIENPSEIDEVMDFTMNSSRIDNRESESVSILDNKVFSNHKKNCAAFNITNLEDINPATLEIVSRNEKFLYSPTTLNQAFPGTVKHLDAGVIVSTTIKDQEDLTIMLTESKSFPVKVNLVNHKDKMVDINNLSKSDLRINRKEQER